MSNTLGFAIARKTSRGNLLAGWLDGGSILVYTADRPASADTAISTQTLLVTFTIPDPAGTLSNGIFTGSAIAAALVATDGNATWARIFDTDDVVIGDIDAGLTGSGAFLQLDSLSLVEGGYVTVTSFTIAEG